MELTLETRRGVSFFICAHPRWRGAAHGFSTRLGGVSPPPYDSLNLGASLGDERTNVGENFRRFCAAVGADAGALVKNHQIHSASLRPVGREDILPDPAAPGTFEADGLVTDQPGVCLTIFSGDCIPILLYDPVRRCVAAAHAGWRGTAGGIAAQGVEELVRRYGSRRENILAAIGPGIGPCCFETHQDVPDALRTRLGQEAERVISPAGEEKFHVDLKAANALWLRRAGVLEENLALCPACTGCDRRLFWSHRKQGRSRGSMAAVIQLLAEEAAG